VAYRLLAVQLALMAPLLLAGQTNQKAAPVKSTVPAGKLQIQLVKNGSSEESEGWDAWVLEGADKRLLPPQAIRESNGELLDYSNKLPYKPEFAISPDGQWIFASQKLWHSAGVGYLFRRKSGLEFTPASAGRFDEVAWRHYVQKFGSKAAKLSTLSDGQRIIDFVSWSADSKWLSYRIRPVKGKDSEWIGRYEVATGRFAAAALNRR